MHRPSVFEDRRRRANFHIALLDGPRSRQVRSGRGLPLTRSSSLCCAW
jgi:hypothetical protein